MENKFKINKELAISLIAVEKRFLGEELYKQILSDPRDHSYTWLNMLEDIANERID